MESLQIRLTPQIVKKVDELVDAGMYASRNEAVRDAVRRLVLNYETISRTRALREEITPKLKGRRGAKLIRDVRDEGDRL